MAKLSLPEIERRMAAHNGTFCTGCGWCEPETRTDMAAYDPEQSALTEFQRQKFNDLERLYTGGQSFTTEQAEAVAFAVRTLVAQDEYEDRGE